MIDSLAQVRINILNFDFIIFQKFLRFFTPRAGANSMQQNFMFFDFALNRYGVHFVSFFSILIQFGDMVCGFGDKI